MVYLNTNLNICSVADTYEGLHLRIVVKSMKEYGGGKWGLMEDKSLKAVISHLAGKIGSWILEARTHRCQCLVPVQGKDA